MSRTWIHSVIHLYKHITCCHIFCDQVTATQARACLALVVRALGQRVSEGRSGRRQHKVLIMVGDQEVRPRLAPGLQQSVAARRRARRRAASIPRMRACMQTCRRLRLSRGARLCPRGVGRLQEHAVRAVSHMVRFGTDCMRPASLPHPASAYTRPNAALSGTSRRGSRREAARLYTMGCQQRMCGGPSHSPRWSQSTNSSWPARTHARSCSSARKPARCAGCAPGSPPVACSAPPRGAVRHFAGHAAAPAPCPAGVQARQGPRTARRPRGRPAQPPGSCTGTGRSGDAASLMHTAPASTAPRGSPGARGSGRSGAAARWPRPALPAG